MVPISAQFPKLGRPGVWATAGSVWALGGGSVPRLSDTLLRTSVEQLGREAGRPLVTHRIRLCPRKSFSPLICRTACATRYSPRLRRHVSDQLTVPSCCLEWDPSHSGPSQAACLPRVLVTARPRPATQFFRTALATRDPLVFRARSRVGLSQSHENPVRTPSESARTVWLRPEDIYLSLFWALLLWTDATFFSFTC